MTAHTYKECRICFEDESREGLISPCACTGSGKYVHNTCLLRWLIEEPTRGLACTVCLEVLATVRVQILETITKGRRMIGQLQYFDFLWQFFISMFQLYIFIWLVYVYKIPYNILNQTMRGIIVGNQMVFILYGLRPWAVHNRRAYQIILYANNDTLYIGGLYSIAIISSLYVPWGGLLAVNIFSTQILAYHHSILEQINKNTEITFSDRPSRVIQRPPSSYDRP